MVDGKQVAAEGVLERIWKEEWHDLDLLLGRTGDVQFWADIMRYELDLGTLTKNLLHGDSTLASLKAFQVETISPFHYAGLRGADGVLRKALQVGLNVEVGLRNGIVVLHLASFAGKMETVALLVDEFQANVNRDDGYHRRPLHYACAQGHQQMAEFLVSRGAEIGARDFEGATAAFLAGLRRQHPIASNLLEASGDGDVLPVEGATGKEGPIYTRVHKNKKRTVPGYEEVELSTDSDIRVEVSGDGEILLVEEQSLVSEVQDVTGQEGPNDINVHKNKKRTVPDYEEVELSADLDTTAESVKENPDAGHESQSANEKKFETKSGRILVCESTDLPNALASGLEKANAYASVSKAQHNDKSTCDEKRHVLKTSKEDFRPLIDSATNSKALSEHAAVDQCDEGNAILKWGRRQHRYEEIKLPSDSVPNSKVSDCFISAEGGTTKTKGTVGKRNRVYQEIELPSDTTQRLEMGLHDQQTLECTENMTSDGFRRNNQYEELDFPFDPADPVSNMLDESETAEIIEAFDISKFVRRKHHYEEIALPCEEDPQNEHFNEHHTELEVRQLLRNELRKLELTGKSVKGKTSNDSDAISNFFDVSENAEDLATDNPYDLEAVITLRQLQRLLREEFQQYAEQLSKIDVGENGQNSKNALTDTSNLTPSTAGLHDEIAISTSVEPENEAGQIETVPPTAQKDHIPRQEDKGGLETKTRDDPPIILLPNTDRKKLETTEQTDSGERHQGEDPRNRKERGKKNWPLHRSPLRRNVQNDKQGEADGSKAEQGHHRSEQTLFKAGQSQFYIVRESQVNTLPQT